MSTSVEKEKFQLLFSKGKNHNVTKSRHVHLYMHPSMMKTLEYSKGSLTLLYTVKGQLLFRCCPCVSLEPHHFMLSSNYLFQDYLKGDIFCDHYNSLLNSADMVVVSCDSPKSFMETESFKKIIKRQLDFFYIRKGLKFNITYLSYPCCFTVKCIYSNAADKVIYEESLQDLCVGDMSSLSINENNSILENSFDEKSFTCSTPISVKNSTNNKQLGDKKINQATNIQDYKLQQFYFTHSGTRVIIQCQKEVKKLNQMTFQHLGGLKKQISELKSLALSLFNQVYKGHGILLIGPSGTGKTAILQALTNEFCVPLFNLNHSIISSNDVEGKNQLKKLYNEVTDNSPSVLFLDNIDNLYKTDDDLYLQGKSLVAFLSTVLHDLLSSRKRVLVIGATCNITAVDVSVRKPGILDKEIYFEIPSAEDRNEILSKILDRKHHNLNRSQITKISEMTHGFTGGDLTLLCDKADISSYAKKFNTRRNISFEDLKEALKEVKPTSMVDFMFEVPKVKWSDIGGMHAVKTAITEMVEWPLKHAEQFKNFKITPSRGILLYGPPGCSKTMIAKALVSEGHLNFISIKGPQLFNKYVGESEKAVSELFKKARSAAPCVLFFDEIDSLTSIRGSTSGNSNVAERILTQLLVEIDGIDVLQGVSIIAATNRPDMIDPSFLRPGRFDQMIYVPLPDYITRKEIFESKLRNMPLASDVNILYLVEATEGYTGAEIADICREAAMSVIPDYITSATLVVTMFHFLTALKSVMPRTSKEMVKFYETYNKRYSS